MGTTFKISYSSDMALFQTLWVRIWLGLLIMAMITVPFFLSRYQLSICNEMGIAIIGSLGLNLLIGFTGQISLGHGAFV
ncbi:MAG: branched-chain amino acid ABC transporter permease, partial [Desulfobacterales bacterium]|nr:branched-chain amino acid ABC transporter permease [Desulfobacterales bacterium]